MSTKNSAKTSNASPSIPTSQPSSRATDPRFFTASKPDFIKLKEDQQISGIFLGVRNSSYGRAYKFQTADGTTFFIGGNRAQLDSIFDDLLGNPQGFNGDTIIGHALIVARMKNTESKSKRSVAVYAIGHDFDNCPKGCRP